MTRMISELRDMEPTDVRYDQTFHDLMRQVMHHVADEESLVLPMAEKAMDAQRLSMLGAQMTRRRMQLAGPHAGEMATATARAMPAATMWVAGGLLTGAYLISRGLNHRRPH
jgi:hypothetical protein